MSPCTHRQLVLVRDAPAKLRCRHCHLSIDATELTTGYCPECFETSQQKRADFDDIVTLVPGRVRYRCEECGGMIETR